MLIDVAKLVPIDRGRAGAERVAFVASLTPGHFEADARCGSDPTASTSATRYGIGRAARRGS